MKMHALRIAVGALVCLAVVAGFSTSGAQAPASPLPPDDGAQVPELEMAPMRSSASVELANSKGYVPPPMDLSHLTGQRMPSEGLEAAVPPSSFDWRDTGKVTSVKNQSTCGSCYAFAGIGNFESKLLIDGAGTFDFSENNAKECNWYETNGGGTSCSGGSYFVVANLFSKKGTVLESCDPYVPSDVDCNSTCPYQKTLLDWRVINGSTVPSTAVLKQYIYDHGPVFTAIYAGYYDAWDTEFSSYDGSYTLYYAGTEAPNHAVLIVGWDDSLAHAGGTGGWIVKNSWGTGWGASGYFTIAYGSASIGTDSSFMGDWQDYDTNGGVEYFDEGGWWTSYGQSGGSNTTAWGLAKFTPSSSTYVTRVEFWTSDATTDVDVHLYDGFDGTTLGSKLAEVLDNSFSEAGYHSVALTSPVSVTGGDDVVAVVKFTNQSNGYPVVVDQNDPIETERTYISISGATGSWTDLGAVLNSDAGIRVRTSTSPVQGPTVTSITPSSGAYTETVHITNLAGTNFEAGATVKLTKTGEPEIDATNVVVVSSSRITCDFDLNGAATGYWNVVVTNPDTQSGTLPNGFRVTAPGVEEYFVHLPLVMRRWPPIPDTPTLNAISNSDGDGNYTVSWNATYLADSYTLQEDDNSSFSSPATAYTGSSTSWNASDQSKGTYYYRVRANNSWGSSGWSNVRSVTVTSEPSGPKPGFWEDSVVEFYVTSDRAYVDDFAISIYVSGCGSYKITHTSPASISNDSFSFTGSYYANGTFSDATHGSGQYGLDHFYIYGCGYVTGGPYPWTATWQHSLQSISTPFGAAGSDAVESVTTEGDYYQVVPLE